MKIALLGGSFDPVHNGHLQIADETASRFGYDLVVFVPAAISPHKKGRGMASSEDRIAMLCAAVLNDRRFLVDDCEIRRSGVSYTIDTIDDIEHRYRPSGKIALIIGEDLVAGFNSWQRVDELVPRVDIILAARPGVSFSNFPYPHRRLDNTTIDVSSSGIRRLIEKDLPWRFLVPEAVRHRIEGRGLYGSVIRRPSPERETAEAVEAYAFSALSPARYLHSRAVARFSSDLCQRFGLDPDRGYLAGIAHDVCKELSDDRIIALAVLDGKPISEIEEDKPSLLHARAAASFLESRFAYRDESVLNAIRRHTFGAPGMDKLSKIVYVADKVEPSRVNVSTHLREMSPEADLQELFVATVEDTVYSLRTRGKTVLSETEILLEECRRPGDESRTG